MIREDLINEIKNLEKENQELKAAIKRIDAKEMFETIKHFSFPYHDFMYKKIPFEFINSVFYYYKQTLFEHANGCFLNDLLDTAFNAARANNYKELIMSIPMFCKNIIKNESGISLVLADPYRTIITRPKRNISEESPIKGRMLVANLVIPENHRTVTSFELKGYKLLKMSLTNIFGKDPPKTNDLINQITKHTIRSKSAAINAIDEIEDYCKKKSFMTYRPRDDSLRILTESLLIGLCFEKNKLWYAEEPSGQFKICNSGKYLNDDIIKTCFTFKDEYLFSK